jgi:hypothetical protein
MPHFVISGYLPENFDPSAMDEAMVEGIHALNREMDTAGITRFSGGLGASHTVRTQPGGDVVVTDGPYLEAKEYVGGMMIIEVADLEEALSWARKSAKCTHMASEVREVFFVPDPSQA